MLECKKKMTELNNTLVMDITKQLILLKELNVFYSSIIASDTDIKNMYCGVANSLTYLMKETEKYAESYNIDNAPKEIKENSDDHTTMEMYETLCYSLTIKLDAIILTGIMRLCSLLLIKKPNDKIAKIIEDVKNKTKDTDNGNK